MFIQWVTVGIEHDILLHSVMHHTYIFDVANACKVNGGSMAAAGDARAHTPWPLEQARWVLDTPSLFPRLWPISILVSVLAGT